ncbi:MAG: hypothetical protein HC781_06625 [Leptolyngbyaceae cyanobacterium CSU_1_4]|nr:hypothetical protein [Leptolyngbyaceae cyanobacterium CSU_1_4]
MFTTPCISPKIELLVLFRSPYFWVILLNLSRSLRTNPQVGQCLWIYCRHFD